MENLDIFRLYGWCLILLNFLMSKLCDAKLIFLEIHRSSMTMDSKPYTRHPDDYIEKLCETLWCKFYISIGEDKKLGDFQYKMLRGNHGN
jgi:hypothetical protein